MSHVGWVHVRLAELVLLVLVLVRCNAVQCNQCSVVLLPNGVVDGGDV